VSREFTLRFQFQNAKTGTVAAGLGSVKAAHTQLSQYLGEFVFVEADEQRLAAAHRGCTQVARRAEQVMKQRFLVRRVRLHVKVDHVLTPSRDDVVHVPNQRQGLVPAPAILDRIGLRLDSNLVLGKKLLRSGAGLSARPVVVPVQSRWHVNLPEHCEATNSTGKVALLQNNGFARFLAHLHMSSRTSARHRVGRTSASDL